MAALRLGRFIEMAFSIFNCTRMNAGRPLLGRGNDKEKTEVFARIREACGLRFLLALSFEAQRGHQVDEAIAEPA
jgi:hypothetical protein